jgi:hypothetical protein
MVEEQTKQLTNRKQAETMLLHPGDGTEFIHEIPLYSIASHPRVTAVITSSPAVTLC